MNEEKEYIDMWVSGSWKFRKENEEKDKINAKDDIAGRGKALMRCMLSFAYMCERANAYIDEDIYMPNFFLVFLLLIKLNCFSLYYVCSM